MSAQPTEAAEEWRPIPGYEGIYEASNAGRVRSLNRINAQGARIRGRVLRPGIGKAGYPLVTLSKGGAVKPIAVHRLVALTFLGAPPPNTEVCHNDGDPTNSRADNLRWDTKSANALDRARHGTDRLAIRTHCFAGHPFDELNTLRRSNGARRCATCERARKTRRKSKVHTRGELTVAP